MSVPYLPKPYFQIDGTAFQQANCVPTTGVILTDRSTVGRIRFTPSQIRAASGDLSGGMEYGTLAWTIAKMTDGEVDLQVRWLDEASKLRDLVASGRAVGVIIDCSVTRHTIRHTGTFTGIHSVTAGAFRISKPGKCKCDRREDAPHAEYRVEDPGTKAGWRWWSARLLHHAGKAAGGGGIWTISTQDTEGVTRVGRQAANLFAEPTRDSKAVGKVRVGRSYTVRRTLRGGDWKRKGGTSNGWHEVKRSTGVAYAKGESLR